MKNIYNVEKRTPTGILNEGKYKVPLTFEFIEFL
jgi:hypothetical protein